MARGPKGEQRPNDPAQAAVAAVRIALGEVDEKLTDAGKDPAAVELGRRGGLKGGKARAARLTAQERAAIARKAVEARWRKSRDDS